MAGTSDDFQSFMDRVLSGGDIPDWTGAGDLSRISVEAFESRDSFDRLLSTGTLRLTGAGVRDHSAALDAVGAICQGFQRVVTSVGAALEGVKSARGPLSEALQRRSRLALEAAPGPGSLVLRLIPETDPNDERHDRAAPSMLGDDPEPLTDRSMVTVLDLLRVAAHETPDGERLAGLLLEMGPRASAAIGDLAKSIADDDFDVDLTWRQPERSTRRVSVTAPQARWLERFVALRRLDASEVAIRGRLRTISDRRALEVETDDGEILYLRLPEDASALDPVLESLRVHDRVEATTLERIAYKVGGGEVRTYVLVALRRVLGLA